MDYTHIPDMLDADKIPADGILSRAVYDDEKVRVIWFGFAPGEELSEHTAAMPAIIHFLQGEARLTLGEDVSEASAGTWVHMPANLPHSIQATTPVIMLLLLLKG
jgi:quercetin dioxygenase-like cupin family protein